MSNFDKPYEDLLFTDNFMFVNTMEHYPEYCREMLELILPVKIDRIECISTEHSIDNVYESKGIRLDVLVKDSDDNIYDAEMQVVIESDLPKRSRYYHSAIDTEFLLKGNKYSDLKTVYVIFICVEKLKFEKQAPIYFFKSTDIDTETVLQDMNYTVLVNSDYINSNPDDESISEELRQFLYLINKGKVKSRGDTFAGRVERLVQAIKEEKKWRPKYMTLYEQIQLDMEAHKDEWMEEGRVEGRTEGRIEGRICTLIELVEQGYITSEYAAKSLGISVEEFNSKTKLLK